MLLTPQKKNVLTKILTLSLVVAFMFVCVVPAAQTAFAQAPGPTPGPQVNPFTGQPAGQVGPPAPPETKPADCGWGIYCNLELLGKNLANWVATALLTFGGLILYLAGILLKAALEYTIVNMTSIVNATADGTLGATIRAIWIIFRDIANMFFIFILLYAAIGTILDLGGVNMKKILRNVIIVAILLNFSLFFTKILVDASNILAITFYNKIIGAVGGDNGIGGVFMQQFGLTSLFDVGGASDVIRAIADNGAIKMLEVGVAGLIFMLVAAFIFFAMSIMFIRRFVAIIFIFMLSPLAFAAMALPNDKYSSRWWKSLWNQLLFPPACLALLWVVLQIQTAVTKHSATVVDSTTTLTSIVAGKGGSAFSGAGDLLMNFVILTVFTVAVLVIANELGAAGASSLMKTGKKWRGNLQSYVGRNTLGRGAAKLESTFADNQRLGKYTDSRIGRFVRGYTTGAVAESKFGGSLSRKEDAKKIKELKTDIKATAQKRDLKAIIDRGVPDINYEKDLKGKTPEEIAAFQASREEQEQELARTIGKMSNKDLENLKAKQIAANIQYLNPRQLEHVLEKSEKYDESDRDKIREARYKPINDAIKNLEGFDPTSETSQAELRTIQAITDPAEKENKLNEFNTRKQTYEDAVKKSIQGMSNKEIELSATNLVNNPSFVAAMTKAQYENVVKPDNTAFTPSQKEKLKELRTAPINNAFGPGSTEGMKREAVAAIRKMDAKDVARLKMEILTQPEVIETYTQSTLTKMATEMNAANVDTLRSAILTAANAADAPEKLKKLKRWIEGDGENFF